MVRVRHLALLCMAIPLNACFEGGSGLKTAVEQGQGTVLEATYPQWNMWRMNARRNAFNTAVAGAITTPVVKWKVPADGLGEGSAAIADLEGNGDLDVVITSYGALKALRGKTGTEIWSVPITGQFNICSPAVADLKGDGTYQVIIAQNQPVREIQCYDGKTGSLLWKVPVTGDCSASPAVADLDGDGKLEVIYASSSDSLYALRWDGSIYWKVPLGFSFWSSPSVGDIDGDGKLDVVCGGGFSEIIAFNGQTGAQKWSKSLPEALKSTPVIADLDNDGAMDIVYAIDGVGVYARRGDNGEQKWFTPFQNNAKMGILSSPVVADLDGDGKQEVVTGAADCRVYCLRGDTGAVKWTFYNGGDPGVNGFESSPAVGDVDGDGKWDVCIGAHTGRVYLINGQTGALKWEFNAVADGGETKVVSSPTLYDVDGDGKLEIIFGSNSSQIFCLRGPGNAPPTVGISSPAANSTVSGTIAIAAQAQGDNGIASVKFLVDGTSIGTGTTAPYSVSWNTTSASNGSHQLSAIATDTAGQTGQATLSVTVQNGSPQPTAPTVTITSPTNNATVSGSVTVTASATGSIQKVEFKIGAVLIGSAATAPYQATWNTTTYTNGSYPLTAVAVDSNGQTASSTITVTVSNAADAPPTVSITQPANNASVSGNVTISATASDDQGVVSVTFFVDNTQIAVDTQAPYTAIWQATPGAHTIKAVAKDTTNQIAQATVNVSVPSPGGGLVGPWPIWRGDIRNTGFQPIPGHLTQPILKWSSWCGMGEATPAVADVDGDGKLDIVCFLYSGYVRVFNGQTGALKWEKQVATPSGQQIASPTVVDLDGDGKPEILICSKEDKRMYVLNGANGDVKWTFDLGGLPMSSPTVADLDGDGKIDILVNSGGTLYALRGDGSVMWTNNSVFASGHSSAAIADVDGDGKLEVLIGTWGGVVALRGDTGQQKWLGATQGTVQSSPVVADLFGDGKLQVVAASPSGGIYCFNGNDGSQKWYYPWPNTSIGWQGSPAVADLNGDGIKDVVAGSGQPDHTLYAINGSNGQLLWKFAAGDWLEPSPLIWDADGDGKLDVIARAYNNKMWLLDGATGQTKWEYTFSNTNGNVACSPVAVDLDGDGNLELIIQQSNERVMVFGLTLAPPTVTITSPANGSTVSGAVTIAASVTANAAVTQVEFFVDNASIGVDTTTPYQITWNATPGQHVIKATATLANGVVGSSTVTVTTAAPASAPPQVSITQPANNATVSGALIVKANSTASVKFFVDAVSIGQKSAAPFEVTWDSTTVANGLHTIKAQATDDQGLTAEASVTVTVQNVTTNQPPVLAPIGNKTVQEGKLLSFTVSATDPEGEPVTLAASGLPTNASFNPQNGQFAFKPIVGQAGTYSVTISASDGALTVSETFTIAVLPVQVEELKIVAAPGASGTASAADGGFYTTSEAVWTGPDANGRPYTGLVMFDLPPGAVIQSVELVLTGKDANDFLPNDASWTVRLVDEGLAAQWSGLTNATIQQAAVRGSFSPSLTKSDLGAGVTNTVKLDGTGIDSLNVQSTSIRRAVIRIEGPAQSGTAIYQWNGANASEALRPLLKVKLLK